MDKRSRAVGGLREVITAGMVGSGERLVCRDRQGPDGGRSYSDPSQFEFFPEGNGEPSKQGSNRVILWFKETSQAAIYRFEKMKMK